MANTTSTEPFKMRIPSPDPELTGEVLAKKIPNDPNRRNTYADQFLAHMCPPEFDELQRRQFFCILDLRRLKYAANEIFAKKDWKLNILNFAKEFEKSRGLIMLRYGLYEFKNVKPSSEVLKRWRAAHNLPDIEDNGSSDSRNAQGASGTGSMKRKADEELAPKDNTLMNSTANQNKRRNIDHGANDPFLASPAPFKKSKRKVDDTEEPDENQPNKLHKPTQSSATSLFASIINKPRDVAASPLKESQQATTLFGVSKLKDSKETDFATKANPFQQPSNSLLFSSTKSNKDTTSSESVLSGHKIGSAAPTTGRNIFSYLPGSPGSSSDSEDDEDAGVAENESEKEHESEEQQPSTAVSTGTNTPPVQNGTSIFATGNKSNASNPFTASTNPAAQTPRGGLFERVQIGTNGKPVRALFGDDKKDSSAAQQSTPASVKPPGDYTFNPATTPISFGQPAPTALKSTSVGDMAPSAKPTTSDTAQPEKPISIFSSGSQATPAPKSSLFGTSDATKSKSSDVSTSIFAPQNPAPSATNIFGASTSTGSLFGTKEQPNETAATTVSEQAPSIFSRPTTDTSAGAEKKSPPANADSKETSGVSASKDKPNIFDSSFIAKNAAQGKSSSSNTSGDFKASPIIHSRSANSLFGTPQTNGTAVASTKSIFGQTDKPTSTEPASNGTAAASTKSIFGQTDKQTSSGSASNISRPEAEKEGEKAGNVGAFGLVVNSSPAPAPATSLFGSQGGAKSVAPASITLFGGAKSDSPAEATKPAPSIFSSTSTAKSPSFAFGSQPASNANTQSSSITFGANATSNAGVSFGSSSSQTNGKEPKKVDFQFGSSAPSASSTPFTFGQDSPSGTGFSFTAGGAKQTISNPFAASKTSSQTPGPVFGANSSTTTPSSSFNFTFQGQPATPKAATSSQGSSIFGGLGSSNAAPSFSFTQATPGQNTPSATAAKPSAPVSVFSHLQAANEASAGASKSISHYEEEGSQANFAGDSPFPAPSSIGTTPVNGTPEPQGPNENGEEAPQEQISLTEGGPGEEDETVVHEVRAKAVKFVPVQKGDEEDDKKSPWRTQGVGPLRILKNKTTGTVRMLLRAEPRGHIALNKALLPDVEYTAREKTINFAAAKDDGSGLETWVLQVKKPEFARELVTMLESNKSANKK